MKWCEKWKLNENGVILSAFTRWTWKYDILFQYTENMPKNQKAMWAIWSEWQMKMTYDMKNKNKWQVNTVRPSRKKRRLRRKGVKEEEGFKFFLWKLQVESAKGDEL